MREVCVLSAGMTAFGAFPERSIRDLACEAAWECLGGAGADPGQVEALYVGNFAGPSFTGQSHLAPWIAGGIGLGAVPCTRFEAACASGGSAFFHAWGAVASGIYDLALVVGVESMTVRTPAAAAAILAAAGDVETEARVGGTFPALFAMIASRYLYEFHGEREWLASVAVKNHAHGLANPRAHLRKAVTLDAVLHSRYIAEPLTLYDCSPISDGAAAVLLGPRSTANGFRGEPVRVRAVAQASGRVALQENPDITTFPAVRAAAAKAYEMAGVEAADISVAEVHDCFTIAELIALEDLGMFPRGHAGAASAEGRTRRDGDRPVNPSGGLKSKGHPIGATGVAQICEAFWQLRGEAGERQVNGAETALTENLGGSGATCVVGIFSK